MAARARRASRIDAAVGSTRVRDRARLSERMGRSARTRLFWQSTVLDFLLVWVLATALSFTVSYGFESAWDYRGNVALVAGLCAPLLAAMYVGTWSKRSLAPSVLATVIVAAAIVAVAAAVSPEPIVLQQATGHADTGLGGAGALGDVPGNYIIFALVVVACSVAAFLLSRRPTGLVFLLLVTILACGTIQFLYREWVSEQPGIATTVVALAAIGMLFVYQCYKQSVYSANRVKRTSFGGVFAFSALVVAVCVLVGAGVFYGAVATAELTTPEIKLFEDYVSPPVDEQSMDFERVESEGDGTTDQTNDDEQQTNDEGEGGEEGSPRGIGVLQNTIIADLAQSMAGASAADEVGYLIVAWELVILGALLVLAVLVAVLLQRRRRKARLKRIAGRSNAYQAWYLYTFLLGRFARMKLRKPAALTPLEFAVGFSKSMRPFTRDTGGVDFVEVSSVYQDAVYGGLEPTGGEMERVRAYYRAFFKNARRYVGWPKWLLWKFWRV